MSWYEEISTNEKEVIEELKKRTLNDCSPKLLEDESVFYRFCKARDYNLQQAEAMLRKHIAWRKEFNVDTILEDYKPLEVFQKYAHNPLIGFDNQGSPIRFVSFGSADTLGLFKSAKEMDHMKFNIYNVETDVELLKQRSKKLGKQLTTVNYIYDMDKLSFAGATNRAFLNYVMKFSKMYQDNYPERIKRMIHINVSIYFTMAFNVAKTVLASALIEKTHFFGSDGYQEFLLKFADADELPAFLGGNRTDPDGNPRCRTIISELKKVPESYYLRKSEKTLSKAPGVNKLTVTRFSKEERVFEVDRAGCYLEWEFETKNRDIGFGVYWTQDPSSKKSERVEVIPKQRLDTCYEPETGMLKCERTGTYVMVFDNSYSWIYPKELYYRARIRDSDSNENQEWE